MENFGPFIDETVDFNRVGDEVYMIVGNTGAGKTMIFDAISFALFGRASGDWRKSVSAEELYCRYGSVNENGGKNPMKVSLVFSENGKKYLVERVMKWGETGKAKNVTFESELKCITDGKKIASSNYVPDAPKNEVTNEVVVLLGLRAQDFKKIVMLAQGEFQQFLKASGAERNEILGRLYDNRRHIDLQTRLYAVTAGVEDRIRKADNRIKEGLEECKIPEDMPEEYKNILADPGADKDDLQTALARLTEKWEEKRKNTAEEKKECEKRRTELSVKLSESRRNNEELDKKQKLADQKKALDEKAGDYEIIEKKLEDIKAAAQVMPAAKKYEELTARLEQTEKAVAALEEEKGNLAKAELPLKKQRDDTKKEYEEKGEQIGKRLNLLEKIMPEYDNLKAARAGSANALTKKREAEEKHSAACERLEGLIREETENEMVLNDLGEAGETAVRNAKIAEETAKNRLNEFESLIVDVKDTVAKKSAADTAKTALDNAASVRADFQAQADLMNKKMRLGRAALLAEEMVRELEDNDEVYCPVCGTSHTKADIGAFAKAAEDMPKEADLDRVNKELLAAQETESAMSGNAERCKTAYENAKENVRKTIIRLMGKDPGGDMPEIGLIEKEKQRAENSLADAKDVLSEAEKAKKRKDEAIEKRKDLTEAKKNAEENKDGLLKELNAAEMLLAGCKIREENAEKALEGWPSDKLLALAEETKLRKEINGLKNAAEAAEEAYNDLGKKQNINEGRLSETLKNMGSLETEKKDASEKYERRLIECGFTDENAYREALSPEGRLLNDERTLRNWQDEKSKAVKAYRKEVDDIATRIDESEKRCKDLVWTDLTSLEEETNGLNKDYSALDKREKDEFATLLTVKATADKVVSSLKEEERLIKINAVIEPMYVNTCKTYKFQDYVLEGFFEEIVNHAARYFSELMDGRLSLATRRHRNKSEKQDKENESLREFDLVVSDETEFNSSVALLSGGQSFEASLALALGLSEVVQMQRAGKVHIDSMFIDEGFGTLDGTRLDRSMEVLAELAGKQRQIGIITHVDKLVNAEQYKKLEVTQTGEGSRITFSDNR